MWKKDHKSKTAIKTECCIKAALAPADIWFAKQAKINKLKSKKKKMF